MGERRVQSQVETMSLASANPSNESRSSKRLACDLPVLRDGESLGHIQNISIGGCFLRSTQPITGVLVEIRFDAGTFGEVMTRGHVVHAATNGYGIQFDGLASKQKRHLVRFISHLNSIEGQRYEARSLHDAVSQSTAITDRTTIHTLFTEAVDESRSVSVIPFERNRRETFRIIGSGAAVALGADEPTQLAVGEEVVALFTHRFDSYSFPATILEVSNFFVKLETPSVVSFSERREASRAPADAATLSFCNDEYDIVEYTTGGFSIDAPSDSDISALFVGSTVEHAQLRTADGSESIRATIMHKSETVENSLRIGFLRESMHSRDLCIEKESVKPTEKKGLTAKLRRLIDGANDRATYLYYSIAARSRRSKSDPTAPHVVEFRNTDGRRVVGLLNRSWATAEQRRAPVLIVVPGYAGRKETMSALAVTLVYNFEKRHKDFAVLRYDGVNNLGESEKDAGCESGENHSLHYCLSDSAADIRGAIAWARNNTHVEASEIILVSVSFSSVAVRVALREPDTHDVAQWIAYMGAADAQNAFMNVAGDFDVWGNYLRGIPNGIVTVGGSMVDGDWCCRDGERIRAITLEDARRDMASLNIPVVWISGKHDAWMDPKRVRDVMSVEAPASRRVVQVDTGHVPTSSDEALAQFRLVTRLVWRGLFDEDIDAQSPARGKIALIAKREWDRVRNTKLDRGKYWEEYMFGGEVGYDLLRYLPSYREFCEMQAKSCDAEGLYVLELGSGTGIAAEHLLKTDPTRLTCVDVAESALHQLRTNLGERENLRVVQANVDGQTLTIWE